MDKALELRNVSIVRDGNYILKSVDLDIYKGENVAVIGPNGSGKTTLIKLLRGDIRPYYDEENPATFRIFGMDRWNLFDVRSRMGVVSMDLQQQFHDDTKVCEVICSGFFNSLDVFRNQTVTEEMNRASYESAVALGIDDIYDREIQNLSLGEMRRALIARALVTKPDLLVLDEPMTGLDIVMKSKFRSMFDILIDAGVSIVMITHELTDIPESVKRVVMVKDGRIFADGPKGELLTSEKVSELFGEPIEVQAELCQLTGMSGHADREGLLRWVNSFEQKPKRVFVIHGEDEVENIFVDTLTGEGFTACAPYNGAQWVIGAEGAVCLQEGAKTRVEHRLSEGQSRAATVFQRLVSAGKRLLRVIEHNEGGANKDLAKFADQINALCDKWDR